MEAVKEQEPFARNTETENSNYIDWQQFEFIQTEVVGKKKG